jgi:hypothetical protein
MSCLSATLRAEFDLDQSCFAVPACTGGETSDRSFVALALGFILIQICPHGLMSFPVLEGIVTVMLALEHLRHLSCRRGLDARQRTRRFVLGCFHRGGPAGDRFLGIKSCLSR